MTDGTDADYTDGKQHALDGHRMPAVRDNRRYLEGFTVGRRLYREANATANHPIPDTDNMGDPKGRRRGVAS